MAKEWVLGYIKSINKRIFNLPKFLNKTTYSRISGGKLPDVICKLY
jgi:hypothetical protein